MLIHLFCLWLKALSSTVSFPASTGPLLCALPYPTCCPQVTALLLQLSSRAGTVFLLVSLVPSKHSAWHKGNTGMFDSEHPHPVIRQKGNEAASVTGREECVNILI